MSSLWSGYFSDVEKKKKVQLVLGSGGARGLAHIGVIDCLLQDGYEIVSVAGCSMGAVIGGVYCTGYLPQYKEWLLKQTKTDVYRLFDIAFSTTGLVKGDRIFSVLKQMIGDYNIENLPIPFVAVAMDMVSRSEVHFKEGDLYKALRASTGMPGVFKPMVEGQMLFVDGGVLNPLPVNALSRDKDTLVVAVNLNGAFENEVAVELDADVPEPEETSQEPAPNEKALMARLRNYFSSSKEEDKTVPTSPVLNYSMFEMLNASYDATLDRLTDVMLALHPADVVVQVPRNVCSVFEFYRAAEIIDVGKKAYEKAMSGIEK